jgi:dUTP pyrophosphatase
VIGPITVMISRAGDGEGLQLPRQMTADAAGFDLSAAVPATVTLKPGEIRLIPCGFHVAIPPGYEGQVRPRSGLALKHGLSVLNAPGTIDSDYRGEVCVILINLGPEPFAIERGARVAQLVICPLPQVKLVEVQTLDHTDRGSGGFGHTGH